MDRSSLLFSLSAVTGGLRPAPGTRDGDLQEARTLAAYEILNGRSAALTAARLFPDRSGLTSPAPSDAVNARALVTIAESAIAGLAANSSAFADIRLFRREHPILTPQLPDSVPPWAAGW